MTKIVVATENGTLDEQNLETLTAGVKEISAVLSKADTLKEEIKDIIAHIYEETGIPKKTIRKVAKTYYKKSFQAEANAYSELETIYSAVVGKAADDLGDD